MKATPPEAAVWRYDLPGGWEVLAGRTAVDNDRLTFNVARANDWWFHVKGVPGSHVILRSAVEAAPTRQILERAAAVAAWHSKARHAGTVAVCCTQAKHVSKPRGSKPGTVHSRKDRTVKVRPALPAG